LKLKCIKFDFVWGSASDPAGGVYSAPPDDPRWSLFLRELREGRMERKGNWAREGDRGREGE